MIPFEVPILVAPTDIDGQGHVNNVVYLRWMQEAAEAHWDAKATAELKTRRNLYRRHGLSGAHARCRCAGDVIRQG